MPSTFAHSVDLLASWRGALDAQVRELARLLREHGLLAEPVSDVLDALRQRLGGDKLVVAFVAEFSRGKSELINAIFFADRGRRILPAAPGRTTMCPVELSWDADTPPGLALLPISTRLDGASLAELRRQPRAWQHTPLAMQDAEGMARTLQRVTETQQVDLDTARALGFWNDAAPDDNPPQQTDGLVDVPAWRHALINLPHPLLKQGLVVIDTPGLNAIGAEPELTVGLLPSAHATVFVLAADTGVTRSDLAVWRHHLSAPGISRYVVLNKIDTLDDVLDTRRHTDTQIEQQCADVARTLELPRNHVFPLSAKRALHARASGDGSALAASRLPALEAALAAGLLPQQRQSLAQTALDAIAHTETQVQRQLTDRRRQLAEQLLELRGLRGKNAAKVRLMLLRANAEAADFEQCTARLQALRAVHGRMLKDALFELSGERMRGHVDQLQDAVRQSLLQLGAKKAFTVLCVQLRERLQAAAQRSVEMHQMLGASFDALNSEHGFSLQIGEAPHIERFGAELDLIERNYMQYLGVTQVLKLAQARFLEQFRRMLVSRLRVVFESASNDIDVWSRSASSQIDAQFREQRHGFKRRREALERIQAAAGDLEGRVAELESDDTHLRHVQSRVTALLQAARALAVSPEPTAPPTAATQTMAADRALDIGTVETAAA